MTHSEAPEQACDVGTDKRVVVVGGGAAAAAALEELRRVGFAGRVTLVGAEPGRPYNRTTVNKGLLSGAATLESTTLPLTAPTQTRWLVGRASGLDLSRRVVRLSHGRVLAYDGVVLATGSEPGRLSGPPWQPVHPLSTPHDAHTLRLALGARPARVVVLGAGLIGTEAAGVLTAEGHQVTLVDQAEHPLAARLGRVVDAWARARHVSSGVADVFGRRVEQVCRRRHSRLEVCLDDGTRLTTDVVVSALGARPRSDWLHDSGLAIDMAVLTDAELRVRHRSGVPVPAVAAAGDVAAIEHPLFPGSPVHSPHWGSALAQGAHAARTVLRDMGVSSADHRPLAYEELPSYSTFVHGTKLHVIGLPERGVASTFVRGDADADRFAVAFTDEHGVVVGGVAVGGAKPVTALRPLITERRPLSSLPLSA